MELLEENHLSCSHCHGLLTSLEHPKHRLCEERWARHAQAVVSAANSKHNWYLHQLYFPKSWGKSWSIFSSSQLLGGF